MKELTRNELAAIKRVNMNTAKLRKDAEKLSVKIDELVEKYKEVNSQINMWEEPVVKMTGFTSEEILTGEYKKLEEEAEIAALGNPDGAEIAE